MAGRASEPEVIWARPERTGRGPRPAYSRADIAAAAVRIADADGIDGVSMRRVAAELGCGTMSLYNYVPRKEDLYELMIDAVSGEYELPGTPSGDWRADMLELGHQTRALMYRHPWLTRVMSTAYAFGPNALRYLEHCLGVLAPLDAPPGTKMELIAMVNGTVMATVANELAMAERSRGLPWSEEREKAVRTAYLMRQVSSGAYPRLAALLSRAPEPGDADEVFERTLRRVLDSFAGPGGSSGSAGRGPEGAS
ncbi:TetR family transcriptional regulator [Streptomyces sp. WAC05374]|uniref:TetR/AcrR family transcriptional regulator n=1 Tax=Streptomyces sp. WAC05374 TaxID=2487420 RepID=UPI000F8714F3|nr:TetR/AcrR family transcriptional regulator C-terminal domain-containing protein [Streptomyces sp. WAC05374]RST06043.1 TetR family transcriptional regulator [Streptomyces sp. WAC05374]TDF40671.1 TetR family transcriptional regulator [Streptomyces sp. WAC05374]TDF49420.1 TetR family transcriptional regulator [Streptomyces sp. WAC05374]TDF49887.1 TetR family transcriptional regulator [Streptomyces sp. WAC05374]